VALPTTRRERLNHCRSAYDDEANGHEINGREFKGVYALIATPMKAAGEIDETASANHWTPLNRETESRVRKPRRHWITQ
jgi:hypothetical protein